MDFLGMCDHAGSLADRVRWDHPISEGTSNAPSPPSCPGLSRLVPGIHVVQRMRSTWMAGTKPGHDAWDWRSPASRCLGVMGFGVMGFRQDDGWSYPRTGSVTTS